MKQLSDSQLAIRREIRKIITSNSREVAIDLFVANYLLTYEEAKDIVDAKIYEFSDTVDRIFEGGK